MNWTEICVNPVLRELSFKIQTDKWGHIVMSPVSNEHGMYQAKIVALLSRLLEKGVIITECSVVTVQSPLPLTRGRGLGRGGKLLNLPPSPRAPLPQAGEGGERLRSV